MWIRGLTFLLTLILALGLAGSYPASAPASQHTDNLHEIYYPWVPNGAMLGESGPYSAALTVQNLEGRTVSVTFMPASRLGESEPPMLLPWTLAPHASLTLLSSQIDFGDDIEGSGVIVAGKFADSGEPARIAGVMKQSAPVPMTSSARTTTDHMTAGGYTALSWSHIDAGGVLPIVQTNSGWNTSIRITNFDPGSTSNTVRLTLRESGGASAPMVHTEALSPGETWTFNLLEQGVPVEWVGSATIGADGNIGAVAERYKVQTNMLIMNQSQPPSGSSARYAPLILRNWHNWNAGISLANLSEEPNEVIVRYDDADGELLDSTEITVPPRGMDFIFTPAGVSGDGDTPAGFVGSAVISGSGPLHAAVDQVKYVGDADDVGHAMSYVAERRPGLINNHIAMPLVQKGDPGTALGNTTGIQLMAPLNFPAAAKVWFLDELGNVVSPEPEIVELPGRGGKTLYAFDFEYLPPGFQGSAYIRITQGEILAIANNVDYQVQFDGSASMNLVAADYLFQTTEIQLSASQNPVPHFSHSTTVTAVVFDRFGERVRSGHAVVISIDETALAGLNFGPGAPYASSGPVSTNDSGAASIEVQLRDSALNSRPFTTRITATHQGVEQSIQISWNAEPTLAPTSGPPVD